MLLAIVACLLLTGCGGGGGGSNAIPPIVAAIQRPDLLFAYFGIMGQQIKETAAHVNTLFPMAWNFENWNTAQGRGWIGDALIAQCEEAVAQGVSKIILGCDFLIFDYPYRYRGTTELAAFVTRLSERNLWDKVVALYPVDEPDLVGLDDATMNRVNTDLHAFGKPVACIYTDRKQWPGLASVDWAGFDKYGSDVQGDGTLADLKRRLRPEQRILLLAGGSDPWRDSVKPVLAYANGDQQVVGIVAFIYGEHGGNKGIRDNGMQGEYAAVGTAIKTGKGNFPGPVLLTAGIM
jgi:hypothetical protein